jgi:hypothetical protein
MHSVRRLSALASQLGGAAVAAAAADAEPPFPALSGTELPPWHGTLPAGLRLRATKGVGTDTRRNRRMNGEEPDNMQPENGRDIWRIELVDVSAPDFPTGLIAFLTHCVFPVALSRMRLRVASASRGAASSSRTSASGEPAWSRPT